MHPVLQIGLGPLGRRIAADVQARSIGRVVAAVDPAPDLVGRELSEVVEGAEPGVRIQAAVEELADFERIRCVLVTTRSDLELCMETFRSLLTRGAAVSYTNLSERPPAISSAGPRDGSATGTATASMISLRPHRHMPVPGRSMSIPAGRENFC